MKSPDIGAPPQQSHNVAVAIGKNTVFGVVARVAQVATRLVMIPVVIAHLGLGGYGIWSIIMTLSAYMRFGSVGVKSAFQKYVAEGTGDGDFDRVNRLLSTGCALMLGLSIAGIIPIVFYSRELARLSGVPAEFLVASARSITVLAVIMLMSNVGAVYEAIVMGGHRIDLARKFTTSFTVAEALAIVVLLHYGYGLFAMACVMAGSELGFLLACYIASKRVVPQIQLRRKFISRAAVYELVRFAGSYQLVNILEVVYQAILPVAILRNFGADAAGVFALAGRLVSSALMLPDAFLLPILSGGAMIYASGSGERIRQLITKAFKATLGLSLFPMAFISAFGATIIYAWTGEETTTLSGTLALLSFAALFQAFSLLGLVLYRMSGRALLDNIRQVLRIIILFSVALAARRIGFYGVLLGLAVAELAGMLFMIFAITKTFPSFHPRQMVPEMLRLTAATAIVVVVGAISLRIPLPALSNSRLLATLQLTKVCGACLLAFWPALWITKSVTAPEGQALLHVFFPGRAVSPKPGNTLPSSV
jgi:O-antigen/teichoic acid export membrane protein